MAMQKTFIIFIISLLCVSMSFGQIGGTNAFQFLDLDFNARSVALGGDFASVKDNDINLSVLNPASISNKMHQNAALNHAFFPAGISVGQLVYGHQFKKIGMLVTHLRYVNYGRFDQTNITGQETGKFTAGDYALGVGYGRELNNRLSIGANINLLVSQYESYLALGAGLDFNAMYHHPEHDLTAIVIARNVGVQFKSFVKNNREPLPVELLAGISYKLPHAPFRFNLTLHDLNHLDLSYNDPNASPTIDEFTQDTIPVPTAGIAEKIFRHVNLGVEIVPTETFFIRIGYNFDRRQTFNIANRTTISGFSGGFGFKVKKLHVNYSVAFYSPAGTNNMLSITSNFSEWKKSTN